MWKAQQQQQNSSQTKCKARTDRYSCLPSNLHKNAYRYTLFPHTRKMSVKGIEYLRHPNGLSNISIRLLYDFYIRQCCFYIHFGYSAGSKIHFHLENI